MKRFTEANKWRDPWFRELSVDAKLVFLYFLDNCDAAGVWEPDYQLANFCLKRDVEWETVWTDFGDRVVRLPSGKRWMRKFIEFQYGPVLNPKNTAHVGVMRRLELAGIQYPPKKEHTKRLQSPSKGATEGAKDKDKDTDKDKDRDRSSVATGGNGIHSPSLEDTIYDAYPRKEARQDALKAIRKVIDAYPVWREMLLGKVQEYAAAVAKWPAEDRQFVPHPATWFNRGSYEDDPTAWERHATEASGKGKAGWL